MASHSDVANRWVDKLTGATDKQHLKGSKVFVHGAELYSYGLHFELARFVRPKGGTPFFLLNGDTYSVTTSRHQSDTRSAVARVADKFPSMIVPYSALASAGIDADSIVPVDIEAERFEETTHRVTVPELVKRTERALAGDFGWTESNGAVRAGDSPTGAVVGPDGAAYTVAVYRRGWDHSARTPRDCGACGGTGHYMSGAIPMAYPCTNPACVDGKTEGYGGFVDYDPPRVSHYRNGSSLSPVEGEPGTFTYSTHRHFLGAACFSAAVTEYSYRPCKAHADNGRGFCDSCSYNVDNAPVELRAGDKVRHSSRPPMIETKRTRRAYFLSAFDSQESHPHYFLAELPAVWDDPAKTRVRPASVPDAFRYLMPAKVRHAAPEHFDNLKRQGDIFAVPAPEVADAHPIAFRYPETQASIPLDGSGRHVVTELVKLTSPDGRTVRYFGRGRIVHQSGVRTWNGRLRGREHAACKLGPVWHELSKNLVPMSAPNVSTGTGRFGRYAPGVAAVRAWSIIGRVD